MALFWSSLLTFYMRRQNGLLHVTDKAATVGNFATTAAGSLSSSNFTSARRHRRLLSSDLKQAIVILATHRVHGVLLSHINSLTHLERNSLIEHCFHRGFDYREILGFRLLCHGIQISLCQLMRILNAKGLYRRRACSSPIDVITAVERELGGSGRLWWGNDDFAGQKSFISERSLSKQRIEVWWGFLRKSDMMLWIKT